MIRLFLLNLFLAAVYIVLTGTLSFSNAILGLLIGYGVIRVYSIAGGECGYTHKLMRLGRFLVYFTYILVKANLEVAWEIITPNFTMRPRIIRYDVRGLSDAQITALANAITLTPGTLTADIREEPVPDPQTGVTYVRGTVMYVHCMYAGERSDAVAAIDELRDNLLRDVFDIDPDPLPHAHPMRPHPAPDTTTGPPTGGQPA